MIELTRLNGNPLYLNSDLIKWAEAAPDTLLTLLSGEKILVRESCAELVERMQQDRLLLLRQLVDLLPEPESFLKNVIANRISGPWSRSNSHNNSGPGHFVESNSENNGESHGQE
jgi:flagellar protein FlbD